jgi:hypothetical protein
MTMVVVGGVVVVVVVFDAESGRRPEFSCNFTSIAVIQ